MAELNRYEVIKSLLDGKLTNKEAGRSLQLTVRQIQRIKKRVFGEGVRGGKEEAAQAYCTYGEEADDAAKESEALSVNICL